MTNVSTPQDDSPRAGAFRAVNEHALPIMAPLFDPDGDGSGQGAAGTAGSASTGTTSGQGSGSTSPHQPSGTAGATSTGAGSTGAAAGGQNTGTAAAAAGGQAGSGSEDRSNWHPPHVNRRISRENAELKRQVEEARRQLAAVTGITPPEQPARRQLPQGVTEEMLEQARQELFLIHPGLAKLDDKKIDAILEFLDNERPTLVQARDQQWSSLGRATARAIETEVKQHIPNITPKGLQRLYGAFYAALQSDDAVFERYQAGDPTLISEFVNDYKQDILDPYHTGRASAAAGTAAAASRLPRGGSSSSVVPAARNTGEQLDPNDEDAIHKRAFKRLQSRVSQGAAA